MAERRVLAFTSLDQIMPEVDRLLAGSEKAGNWSLGQICNHLAQTFRMSVEGFGVKAPWIARMIFGPIARKEMFVNKRMRAGIKVPEKFCPKPGLDDRAEAEALRASIAYYRANPTPRAFHPLLGALTGEQWDVVHLVHSAHHLGFAIPTAALVAN